MRIEARITLPFDRTPGHTEITALAMLVLPGWEVTGIEEVSQEMVRFNDPTEVPLGTGVWEILLHAYREDEA